MPRDLLVGAGASVTGKWVRTEPVYKSTTMRVMFVSHSWAGDNVYLEELVGGLPGFGANSPFAPQADTGTVIELGAYPPGSSDIIINAPVEFMRARTGSGLTGTVDVHVLEAQ
jgi:hypothetical protein